MLEMIISEIIWGSAEFFLLQKGSLATISLIFITELTNVMLTSFVYSVHVQNLYTVQKYHSVLHLCILDISLFSKEHGT